MVNKNINSKNFYCLNDLKNKIKCDIIVSHGIGKGGGEKVAKYLNKLLKSDLIYHNKSIIFLIKYIIFKKYSNILFTSGPRDIPLILVSFLLRKKIISYVQVPYLKTLSFYRPFYSIIIIIYYLTLKIFADKIFVNSSNTKYGLSNAVIVLPIPIIHEKTHERLISKNPIINIIGRFNSMEKAIGSRDVNSIIKILSMLYNYNKKDLKLIHYGEIDSYFQKKLSSLNGVKFQSKGYLENWVEESSGIFLFCSRYEGFGLAAYEASMKGYLVYVNNAFPVELSIVCENIIRYNSTKDLLDKLKIHYDKD